MEYYVYVAKYTDHDGATHNVKGLMLAINKDDAVSKLQAFYCDRDMVIYSLSPRKLGRFGIVEIERG